MKTLIIIICLLFNPYVFCQNKTANWNTYVQPIIDSVYGNEKKVYLFRHHIIEKEVTNDVLTFMDSSFNIDKVEWEKLYSVWFNNSNFHPDWSKGISSERRNKLTRSRKFEKKKIEVLSISKPIFITRNIYLLSITRYCSGMCSSTDIYFIEIDRITRRVLIIRKINVGVS